MPFKLSLEATPNEKIFQLVNFGVFCMTFWLYNQCFHFCMLKVPIGAVIVNSDTSEVVASCYDLRNTDSNPLYHAVMLCVDLVAHSQGGGAWKIQGR